MPRWMMLPVWRVPENLPESPSAAAQAGDDGWERVTSGGLRLLQAQAAVVSSPSRPCPGAGRSLWPSWPPLIARRLRFAILAPLAVEPGSKAGAARGSSQSVLRQKNSYGRHSTPRIETSSSGPLGTHHVSTASSRVDTPVSIAAPREAAMHAAMASSPYGLRSLSIASGTPSE